MDSSKKLQSQLSKTESSALATLTDDDGRVSNAFEILKFLWFSFLIS
jgi:hypothetical protein